jgi:hypothetical protein
VGAAPTLSTGVIGVVSNGGWGAMPSLSLRTADAIGAGGFIVTLAAAPSVQPLPLAASGSAMPMARTTRFNVAVRSCVQRTARSQYVSRG